MCCGSKIGIEINKLQQKIESLGCWPVPQWAFCGYRSEALCLASRKSFKDGLVISLIQQLLAVIPIVKALSLADAAPTFVIFQRQFMMQFDR
jgi:hypothetical protein